MSIISTVAFVVQRFWYLAIHDHGNVLFLILNFLVNFLPVFIWLAIFKNAGLIPTEWRPEIHVKLVYYLDVYFYGLSLIGFVCALLTIACGLLLYLAVFRVPYRKSHGDGNFIPLLNLSDDHDNSKPDCDIEEQTADSSSAGSDSAVNDKTTDYTHLLRRFLKLFPPGYSPILITLLFALSWPILNIDYFFAQPDFICPELDIFAWVLYVLCHLIVPIVTAVYLYVFQAPGALKYFLMCLGFQNIAGVLTHLAFPNAPPWFIHLNGLDVEPDYDMPGFAAGLTRVDVALGTHLNSKGFHKSPIVFGAFPSLHLAMAVQVFLHLNYYSSWWIVKFHGALFVIIQWWATIYLDHHFRADLFCGMIYAYTSFIIFRRFRIKKVYERFYESYYFERDTSLKSQGTTMGMRVFKGSPIAWFFDPYQ